MSVIILKKILVVFIIILFLPSVQVQSFHSYDVNKSDISFEKNQYDSNSKIQWIIDMIDRALVEEYLTKIVSYGPRPTGSFACFKTAEYLINEFRDNNLDTKIHNWSRRANRFPKELFISQNVEGIHYGSYNERTAIIFNAHYDSVKKSPGADDDGSGVASVLAAAAVLSQFDFAHDIRFVLFSGEENGLLGSSEYVRDLYEDGTDLLVELNADMIANTNTEEGDKKLRVYGTEDIEWILDVIEQINNDFSIDYFLDVRITDEEERMGSDYAAFTRYGFETIAFFEGEWNIHYHSPRDTIDRINIDYLVNNTKIIAATIAYLADITDIPPQIMIESPKLGYLYYDGRKIKQIDELETKIINDIWIWADVTHGTRPIEKVEFFYDGKLMYTDTEYPYKWHFNKISFRSHRVTAKVYDDLGRTASDWRDIEFINLFRFN